MGSIPSRFFEPVDYTGMLIWVAKVARSGFWRGVAACVMKKATRRAGPEAPARGYSVCFAGRLLVLNAVNRSISAGSAHETSPAVWAIGDIHGQARLLDALLAELPRSPGDYTVFLGDYIDRGPDSPRVVERVLAEYDRDPGRTILLWGNHEVAAAGYFHRPNPLQWAPAGPMWPPKSFLTTLRSFGIAPSLVNSDPCPELLDRLFGLLRTYWRCTAPGLEHVLFVHAGVPPGARPEEADPGVLVSIRKEFTAVEDPSGRLIVFGHTTYEKVFQRVDKIGIDTGAGSGGALSALQLPAMRCYTADPEGSVKSLSLLPLHR